MLTSTFQCDLCKKDFAERRQWHGKAVENYNLSLDFRYIDAVNFPAGWIIVDGRVLCKECIKETLQTLEDLNLLKENQNGF